MELRLVKTLWGVDDAAHPERWPALFARIKAEGFAAIECPFITWMQDEAAFTAARKAAGLDLVVQVHTTAKVDATGFHYMTSRALDDHTASLDAMVGGTSCAPHFAEFSLSLSLSLARAPLPPRRAADNPRSALRRGAHGCMPCQRALGLRLLGRAHCSCIPQARARD